MRDKFKEFHKFDKKELGMLWDEAIFVFDTNVLLDLYRYSSATSNQYLHVLSLLKNKKQIWMPYQVGLEFYKNRFKIISDLKKSYTSIKDFIVNSIEGAKTQIMNNNHGKHPFLNLKKISADLESCKSKIIKDINSDEEKHPNWFENDDILRQVEDIFSEIVGDCFKKEKMEKIFEEGELRYADNIPPGFKDKEKEGDDCYGDLVLWYQMIDFAKINKRPIIFVTRDKKEDWWIKLGGNTVGPRYELKKEMMVKAGVDFHMYNSESFFKHASAHFKITASKSIDEIKKVATQLEKIRFESNEARHSAIKELDYTYRKKTHVFLNQIENLSETEDFLESVKGLVYDLEGFLINQRDIISFGKLLSLLHNSFFKVKKYLDTESNMVDNDDYSDLKIIITEYFNWIENTYLRLVRKQKQLDSRKLVWGDIIDKYDFSSDE